MTSPTILNLNGTWRLGCVPAQALTFRGDDRAAVQEWLPATVPGNIHADLMRARKLPDLYLADHIRYAEWVDQWDWWLEREVMLTLEPGQRAVLHFDGIDYYATIWLDGQLLTSHEGAFSRHSIELTAYLSSLPLKRSYRLAVRLWGASKWPLPAWRWWEKHLLAPLARLILPGKASLRPYHPRLRLLRAPMQAGWDFAPQLAAIGLWEGVYIELMGLLRIEALRFIPSAMIQQEKELKELKEFSGVVIFNLNLPTPLDLSISLTWQPYNFAGQDEQLRLKRSLNAGNHLLRIPLTISQPSYWHPWQQGKPNLYQLTVTISYQSGFSSSATLRFALRTIEWHQMRLKVNGQPFFARAINWVPSDILLGTVTRERYEELLGLAVEAGVNLVRVWGGGGRERREFYEICDELGLLIWQEFPFACAFLDHYPRDDSFLSLVEQEASAMVRELRHHPSLALWGAGNEFSYWRNRPLINRLANIVTREDRRPFLRPSPSHHDRHNWHIWHGKAPLHLFAKETTPFLSEFGLQALPNCASLKRFLAPTADSASLWPPNPLWELHHAELERLQLYASQDSPTTLEHFIEASQLAQAQGIQLAIEQMRRRQAFGAGGVALWQWNEPWPAISWALVDYYGTPKKAAQRLHEWYAPQLLSLEWAASYFKRGQKNCLEATLWAINDLNHDYPACEARILQENQCLWSIIFSLPAHSAKAITTLSLTLPDTSSPLRLELWQSGTLLTSNHYQLDLLGPQQGSLFSHLYRTLAEWIMRL